MIPLMRWCFSISRKSNRTAHLRLGNAQASVFLPTVTTDRQIKRKQDYLNPVPFRFSSPRSPQTRDTVLVPMASGLCYNGVMGRGGVGGGGWGKRGQWAETLTWPYFALGPASLTLPWEKSHGIASSASEMRTTKTRGVTLLSFKITHGLIHTGIHQVAPSWGPSMTPKVPCAVPPLFSSRLWRDGYEASEQVHAPF